MFYDKLKAIDLQAMTVNGITPNYTVERYDIEIDETTNEQTHYAYGVNIIKTVEQVIQDWRTEQNAIPTPSQQDTLNAQLLKDNATMKVEISNQKALNSQLILEIAKLKGGTANV